MPEDREKLLTEAYNRGILPPDMKAAYEQAVERGIIKTDGFLTRTAKKAINLVTGEGRKEPGIKEFTTTFDRPNPMKTAAGMVLSTDENQMSDVIKNNIPGAEFKDDKFGNKLIKPPGEDWQYINKPGLSKRDVVNAIPQGYAYLTGAKMVGGAAKSLLPKALLTGASAAGTSVGLDYAAEKAGSEQGVNIPRAGAIGAVGAGAELLAPVFSAIWRLKGGAMPSVQNAKKILVDAGYDPASMTNETLAEFIKTAKKAANVDDAVRLAEAKGLPVPVPLTRGKITMSPRDQMFEDLASKGAYGESAESIMKGANARSDQALRQNVPAIRQEINPGGVVERGQAGDAAQKQLVQNYESMRRSTGEAYDSAMKHIGTKAEIPKDAAIDLAESIQKSFADYMPSADKAKGLFDDLLEKTTNPKKGVSIKDLYDWRRKASTQKFGADRTNASAMKQMISKFDSAMDDYVLTALMNGDEAAIREWKQAIRLRKLQGQMFEGKNIIGDLVKKTPDGAELKISPESVSNYIFGVSDTKLVSRPELARELRKLKSMVDKPAWDGIREEAFIRLAQRGEKGAMTGGDYGFSGVNFKKAVDKTATTNPEVWNMLFTPKEQGMIRQFANVAARATNPVRGGANFSNTAVGQSRMIQSLANALFIGEKGKAILSRIFPMAYEGVQMGAAARSATGSLPLKSLPPGMAGGAAAAVESQTGFGQ